MQPSQLQPASPSTRCRGGSRDLLLLGVVVLVTGVAGWLWTSSRQPTLPELPLRRTGTPQSDDRAARPWFEDAAASAGVTFEHVRGLERRMWMPEISSGGAGFLDHDGDGDLDLYLVQGGDLDAGVVERPGNQLFRNDGDGTFTDVTSDAGLGDTGYGNGCACGDYDADGDVDIYVANLGRDVLYRNDGDGAFTDVSDHAGITSPGWSTSVAFLDYDADGFLDIFVCQYLHWSIAIDRECFTGYGERDYCGPLTYNDPARDVLYRNRGDGTFEDVTVECGIDQAYGNGLGVTCADFDRNGWVDVYVANDGVPNQLWLNQEGKGFLDRALETGSSTNRSGTSEAGMGVLAADIENDGDIDIFLTHLANETNTAYVFEDGLFEDLTAKLGLATPSLEYTGFGVGMADFDQDGNLDIYVANGRVTVTAKLDEAAAGDRYGEPNQLFRGLGGGRFAEVMPQGGTARRSVRTSRAAAFADYDNDGDVDVVVIDNHQPVTILRNDIPGSGRWIMFDVRDERGQLARGARVAIQVSGASQWRLVEPAYSFQVSNDPRVHFGLGAATSVEQVTVHWLDGSVEVFGSRAGGRLYRLRRGDGQ